MDDPPVSDLATSEAFMAGLRALVTVTAPQLSPAQVDQVVASRIAALPGVAAYRALPLAFVGDVIEPAHATAWLESAP